MSVRLALNILLVVAIVATVAGGRGLLFRDSGSADGVTITLDEPEATPRLPLMSQPRRRR